MSTYNVEVPLKHTRSVSFGDCELDFLSYTLTRAGKTVHLQPKSFATLEALVRRAGQLVTKDELIAQVWPGQVVTDSALTRSVKEVRRALGDDAQNPRYIQTVPRMGYRFIGEPKRPGVKKSRPWKPWAAAAVLLVVVAAAGWWLSQPAANAPAVDARTDIVALNADRFEQEGWQQLSQRGTGIYSAIDAFEQAISVDSRHARAMAGLAIANMLLRTGDSLGEQRDLKVRHLIEQALQIEPGLGRALAAQGLYLLKDSSAHDEAKDVLTRAIEADPQFAEPYSWLANLLIGEGRLNEAIELRASALKLDPVNATLTGNLAMSLAQAGRLAEAWSLIESHESLDGGVAPMLYPRASIFLQQGNKAQAATTYMGAIDQRALHPFVWVALAEILLDMGLLDQAERLIDLTEQRLCPGPQRSFSARSKLLLARQDYPALKKLADRYSSDKSMTEAISSALAKAAFQNGQNREVVSHLQQLFGLTDDFDPAFLVNYLDDAHYLASALIETDQARLANTLLEAVNSELLYRKKHGYADSPGRLFSNSRNAALLNQPDVALPSLQAAVAAGWAESRPLEQDGRWRNLWSHEGFAAASVQANRQMQAQVKQLTDAGLTQWLKDLNPRKVDCSHRFIAN